MKNLVCSAFVIATCMIAGITPVPAAEVVDTIPVDKVWSGHSVGFALLTDAPWQYAAYYNADRELTVASRHLDKKDWTRVALPESLEWDSHNYVTLFVDDGGYLHLSGNMHCDPLVYFKTTEPHDIQTFARLDKLVGQEEDRMTYPRFFQGPTGELIYTYRDGSSGSGNQIYNTYDSASGNWSRLLDAPLTDGGGNMNAYLAGPSLGPDGYYHLVWVWRDTPDCATNHDVSYMRSRDLRLWENVRGEPLKLPVTIKSPGTIVDPVPPGGGVINGNVRLGFDGDKRPIVSYHKYDAEGNSQAYNARWSGDGWFIAQATEWDSRWEFGGRGTISFDVRVSGVSVQADGTLVQGWSHWELGRERWEVDPATLRATKKLPLPRNDVPAALRQVRSNFPGMTIRTTSDSGKSPESGVRYQLRWETLGPNRDRPRQPPLPAPSELSVYRLRN